MTRAASGLHGTEQDVEAKREVGAERTGVEALEGEVAGRCKK